MIHNNFVYNVINILKVIIISLRMVYTHTIESESVKWHNQIILVIFFASLLNLIYRNYVCSCVICSHFPHHIHIYIHQLLLCPNYPYFQFILAGSYHLYPPHNPHGNHHLLEDLFFCYH